jgi:hypothetical protein
MKSFVSILVCVITAVMFMALAGCNGNGEVIPVNELLPPTNIRALSKDTAVQLIWAASAFQTDPSFHNYRIITTGATARIDSTTNPANANTIIIPGLINGTVDTFTIFTVRNDGAISAGKSIIWGPTVRYVHRRIYEFDSPNPSGLSLKTGIAVSFVVYNQDSIDLWIDGQGNTQPVLKSPSLATASSGWVLPWPSIQRSME